MSHLSTHVLDTANGRAGRGRRTGAEPHRARREPHRAGENVNEPGRPRGPSPARRRRPPGRHLRGRLPDGRSSPRPGRREAGAALRGRRAAALRRGGPRQPPPRPALGLALELLDLPGKLMFSLDQAYPLDPWPGGARSPFNTSSTTRRAAGATSCTRTRHPRRSCPTSSAPSHGRDSATSTWSSPLNTAPRSGSGGSGTCSARGARPSPSTPSPRRWSATRTRSRP